MKALSFRQPWAELILQGRKTIDLRSYQTNHRGALAIHVPKKVDSIACHQYNLSPDSLPTGGIVGVVELCDITRLTETEYLAHQSEHLSARSFQDPMYGWVLAAPHRLPKIVPARGRMSLFNVNLPPDTPKIVALPSPSVAGKQPFELRVRPQPVANGTTGVSYALTLRQRVVEPPEAAAATGNPPNPLTHVVTLSGDSLKAVADHVLDALRQAGYRVTDLSANRTEPFYLPEAVGVRLGLVFLAVKPLRKFTRVEAISHGIRRMPPEEAYYWYSKCTATGIADRAQKALRVLLAAE